MNSFSLSKIYHTQIVIIAAAEKVAKEGEAKSQQEMALAEKELIKIKNPKVIVFQVSISSAKTEYFLYLQTSKTI